MWRAMLSHPLPVKGLVSRYLTNYLIGRSPLSRWQAFDLSITSGITQSFPWLSPALRHVGTYYSPFRRSTRGLLHFRARLACFSHAASVQSEPGSNSSIDCRLTATSPEGQVADLCQRSWSPGNHSPPGRRRMVGLIGPTPDAGRRLNLPVLSRTPRHAVLADDHDSILVGLTDLTGITRMFDGRRTVNSIARIIHRSASVCDDASLSEHILAATQLFTCQRTRPLRNETAIPDRAVPAQPALPRIFP
jgi:hypothetical protein